MFRTRVQHVFLLTTFSVLNTCRKDVLNTCLTRVEHQFQDSKFLLYLILFDILSYVHKYLL